MFNTQAAQHGIKTVAFCRTNMSREENRSISSTRSHLVSILDAIPETELAAFVDTIPTTQFVNYFFVMKELYIHNYLSSSDQRQSDREKIAIFNYILNGTALPEAFSERRKLQLAALKRLVERDSSLRIEVEAFLRIANILYSQRPATAGGRRRKTKRNTRRSRRSMKNINRR